MGNPRARAGATVTAPCRCSGTTHVNGRVDPWSPKVWELWRGITQRWDGPVLIYRVNYFTPRPWENEYDRGSPEEGFVYTARIQGRLQVGFEIVRR